MSRALLGVACGMLAAAPAMAQPAAAPPTGFAASGIADWTTPPPPTAEPTFRPPVGKRLRLANGLQVRVIENHALPIVSMMLVVSGAGSAADPAGKGGLAEFTADLLDEGAGGRTPIAIAAETDRLGARISIGNDADAAYVSIDTLSRTLAPTLALATSLVTTPAFDDAEVARVKSDLATDLDLLRDRPEEVASQVIEAALYGATSPYGHPGSGTRAGFKDVTAADARAFYAARWSPATMTLLVVGDVDARALERMLAHGLGAWRPQGATPAAKLVAPAAPVTHRLLLVDRPGAAQSDVQLALVGPARTDPRYFAFEVYRTALGGGFTSRLVQRLREQLGITYGIGAHQDYRVAPGPFVISSAIVTPATGQGLTEVLQLVDGLATTEVPAAELDKVKQSLIRALPARFATNEATVATLAELALLGLPDDWYARYAAGVRKVTARDVKAAAAALVPAGKLVIAVVGDLAKIRGDLEKLGLGAPAMYDPFGGPLAP